MNYHRAVQVRKPAEDIQNLRQFSGKHRGMIDEAALTNCIANRSDQPLESK